MPTKDEIRHALHAGRVVPLNVSQPHGPLGLEQLAAEVAMVRGDEQPRRIRRPIALSVETWERLRELADSTPPGGATRTSTSELAAALLEQIVTTAK